jgi:FtsZ-interacting cell division protein ZipA
MHDAREKRARRQNNRSAAESTPVSKNNPENANIINVKVRHLSDDNLDSALLLKELPNRLAVETTVRLRSRSPHGRALASVQNLEMNPGTIDRTAHDAV